MIEHTNRRKKTQFIIEKKCNRFVNFLLLGLHLYKKVIVYVLVFSTRCKRVLIYRDMEVRK